MNGSWLIMFNTNSEFNIGIILFCIFIGIIREKNWTIGRFCLELKTRQSRYAENPRDTAVFEASSRHGDFFEKTKNSFLNKVNGSMRAKFQVCTVFVWVGGVTQINKQIHTHTKKQIHTYTSEIRNILDRVLASRGFWKYDCPLIKNLAFKSYI